MNWVALDRGIRLADKRALPADRAKWMRERDKIYEEVMTKGWNGKRHAFTQFYAVRTWTRRSDHASGLLHGSDDPRMLSTISAILKNRGMADSSATALYIVIHRNPASTDFRARKAPSHVLFLAGRGADPRRPGGCRKLDQARLLFERVLGYAIISDSTRNKPGRKARLGNFPQAFNHLALISAAFNLDRMLGS